MGSSLSPRRHGTFPQKSHLEANTGPAVGDWGGEVTEGGAPRSQSSAGSGRKGENQAVGTGILAESHSLINFTEPLSCTWVQFYGLYILP